MAKLLITTQIYENYGAHDWDGEGECPQYWKAKGGNDYIVKDINLNRLDAAVIDVWNQVESANEYYRETILGWEVVADDYLTEFERDQLDYEGIIRFPAKELALGTM
jgi:hypothetical protein